MGQIVNLRAERKVRKRAAADAEAAANRAAFGRTRSDKARDAAEVARRDAMLDGVKREE